MPGIISTSTTTKEEIHIDEYTPKCSRTIQRKEHLH